MSSYWHRTLQRRLSRRRALAAGSAFGLSAASMMLLACGSDSGGTSQTGGSSPAGGTGTQTSPGLLTEPVDTGNEARRGGTFRHFSAVELPNLDPIVAAASGFLRNRFYQKLVRPEAGYQEPARVGAVEPDAIEGWESSDDGLKFVFHLRRDNHYDPRPPTSGRVVTSDDVLFTFERVESDSGRRADLFQSANADAPIVSYYPTDERTFVLELAYPDYGLLANLGTQNSGFPADILPREGETGAVDLRADVRGSGPWLISQYQPSARIEFERNPGYFDATQPYIDRIELPIITEYASQLAQFRAGNIYTMPINPIDILPTKRALPAVNLYAAPTLNVQGARVMWGWKDSENSPFRDVRARQAFAHAIDRPLFIEAIYSVQQFEDAGLPVETRYNTTTINASFDGFWLDPLSSGFGPNSKYFEHDLTEARALLAAAGYENGLDADAVHLATDQIRPYEVIIGMVREIGIRLIPRPLDNRSDYTSNYTRGRGNFEGLTFGSATSGADPGNQLYALFHSKGSVFTGFDVSGTSAHGGDPRVDEITTKIRQAFDIEERWVLAHELQRYEAEMQYNPLLPGGARGFDLAWPALANYGTWRANQSDALERTWWIDDTKAPLV